MEALYLFIGLSIFGLVGIAVTLILDARRKKAHHQDR